MQGVDDIIDELEWRGLLAITTDKDELRRALSSGRVTMYGGFDPTAGVARLEGSARAGPASCGHSTAPMARGFPAELVFRRLGPTPGPPR